MSDFIDPDKQKEASDQDRKDRNRRILHSMKKHPINKYLREGKRKMLETYEEFCKDDKKVISLDAKRKAKENAGDDRK